ncbi:MAG: T9SS type A sorting domain-containing protein [Calditrichaeota bacterium]|nr:T9SS type A sorting domain-containing protein [Calditrichota bacterium]
MKCVTFCTLICFEFSFQFLPAQAPDTLWTKTFGNNYWDRGNSVQQTSDGGYIIVGLYSVNNHNSDVWLIKTDFFGDTIWTKTYGGINSEWGSSVQQTVDGGYIIAGNKQSNIWLIKTDAFGDTLWTKTFGKDGQDEARSVQQTSDGGYILTGTTNGEIWLIKTDSHGDTLWTKTFGKDGQDEGRSVQQTSDGGYILTGTTNGEIWLIKTDSYGDSLWTKTFTGEGWSVQETSDGGYIIAGDVDIFGTAYEDVYLIKTNPFGDTLWTKTFGGVFTDFGLSVQQTLEGGFIIAGFTDSYGQGGSDIWLIKTDSSGDMLWTKLLGGSYNDYGLSIQQTLDRGYILTGYTGSYGAGMDDVWLIKISPDLTTLEKNNDVISLEYFLHQNFPNPFNPTTIIKFDLPKTSEVTLKVFNILGEEVATLLSGQLLSVSYEYDWSRPAGMASGVYMYRLQAGDYVETRKMVLMR